MESRRVAPCRSIARPLDKSAATVQRPPCACYDSAHRVFCILLHTGASRLGKMDVTGDVVVAIGDRPPSCGDVAAIARRGAKVRLSDAARQRLAAARAIVDRLAAGVAPVYGLNTGLGAGVDTRLA